MFFFGNTLSASNGFRTLCGETWHSRTISKASEGLGLQDRSIAFARLIVFSILLN